MTDDGFGGTDTVLNFERVYGSYHDDIVQLHDIYRGYTPLYGNDTITGPSTEEIVNNSYLGYWNLENVTQEGVSKRLTLMLQKRISFSILMPAPLISTSQVVFTILNRLAKLIIRIPSQTL